ncbi:MAG TPA: nuclear transport factor 2 family protein [Terriglobales bacterium]
MPVTCFSDAHSKSAAKRALALASILLLFLIAGFASSNQASGDKAPAPLANASAIPFHTSAKADDTHVQASALAVLGRLAVLSHASPGGKPPDSDEAAEVERLDREFSAAGVRGDVDATARLLADEAIFVDELHASGKTTTKADNLAFMKLPDYKQESETFDEIHAKQFGDTVVLWGPVTSQATYKNKPVRDNFDFTDVRQNRDGDPGAAPETGFAEINGDLPEADFLPASWGLRLSP